MPRIYCLYLLVYPRGKMATNSQINLGIPDANKNSHVLTIKILLDIGDSTSIVSRDSLHERHRIIKNR